MFLCRTLTHRPLAETKEIISSAEFIQWRALYLVEPWGDEWLQTGSVMAMLFNRWRKSSVSPASADEFIPKLRKTVMKKPVEHICSILSAYAANHNAAVQRTAK